MHILGIYLVDGDKSVIKNLQPNSWYPLYDLKTFESEPDLLRYSDKENFYKLDDSDSTRIAISCIVGQNGSGKSTLLDIFYRILNNLSWHIKNSNKNLPTQIYYAYGFHAKLYFELFGEIGFIEIVANDFDKSHGKDSICLIAGYTQNLSKQTFDINKLNGFFYTIVTNYSLYSFTPDDYIYQNEYFKTEDENEYFFYPSGVFNKNDGYISPIVLLPYRDDKGKILTDNEKDLAVQRIIALSIYLYRNHRTSLIENRLPDKVTYSINHNYNIDKDEVYQEHKEEIDNISKQWGKYYESELKSFSEEYRQIILFYLGYKTFKFIMRYGFQDENASQTKQHKQVLIDNFDESYINRIISEDRTFMTLKIRQTCHFIQHPFLDLEKGSLDVNTYFNNLTFNTIDDYFLALPPPFYTYDLTFKNKENYLEQQQNDNDFSLNKMSSGEKQLLFNLSYVLYHLKNLSTKRNLNSGTAINATPVYKNAVLIFDEAELYLHPEFQRQYIYRIIKSIQECQFENIKDIHIIFATHSPYLLSDVPSNNVLMLENGKIRDINFSSQTFSANIYDLLKFQFFMTSPVGEFARVKIQRVIQMLEHNERLDNKDYSSIVSFIKTIGDDYIRNTLESLLREHKRKLEGYNK